MAGIFNKLTGATDMTKTAADTSNLKKKILYEQERIQEVMLEIGKQYYNNPKADLSNLCNDIDDRKRRIANMKNELHSIKGLRVCSNCGTKFDDKYTFEFCGKCGAKLPNED